MIGADRGVMPSSSVESIFRNDEINDKEGNKSTDTTTRPLFVFLAGVVLKIGCALFLRIW